MAVATKSVVSDFQEQGFVKVKGVLDPATVLDPIIEEYEGVLDNLARDLYEDGEIASEYKELPFDARILKIYQETGRQHAQYFDFSLPFQDVKEDTPCWFGPAVFNAFVNENLLDVLEQLIGPEISSNPVQHVRIKPPEKFLPKTEQGQPLIGATLWHQDHGVVVPEADETNMVTVWFSLTDTPVESGPLNVVPGTHRGDLLTHCDNYAHNTTMVQGRQIPEKLFPYREAMPLPTARGDVIFMHKRNGARLVGEPQREYALVVRPPIPQHWCTFRPHRIPGIRGEEPVQPRLRASRPCQVAQHVDGLPQADVEDQPGRTVRHSVRPLGRRTPRLRELGG